MLELESNVLHFRLVMAAYSCFQIIPDPKNREGCGIAYCLVLWLFPFWPLAKYYQFIHHNKIELQVAKLICAERYQQEPGFQITVS